MRAATLASWLGVASATLTTLSATFGLVSAGPGAGADGSNWQIGGVAEYVNTRRAGRSVGGAAALTATSRTAAAGAGIVTTIVLARQLGPTGWGEFYLAQSVVAVFMSATSLGVEHGIAYFVSADRWESGAAFASAMKFAAVSGALGAAVAIAIRLAAPSAFAGLTPWLTGIAVAALPCSLVTLYASYIALAMGSYGAAVTMQASQAVLVLCLCVPAAILFGVSGAVAGATLAAMTLAVAAFAWGCARLTATGHDTRGDLARAVSFGVKGWAANALQLINYRVDLFILASVASAATVGGYSTAVAITSMLWILPRALSDVLFPRIASLSSSSGQETTLASVEERSIRHAAGIVMVTGLLIAVGLVFLLVPVFGESYRPAVQLGLILLPGACAIGIGSVLAANVVGRGRPDYSLYGALISTPLTLALYAVLIPRFSATGAAVASTTSYVAGFLILCWFFQRTTRRSALRLLFPTRAEAEDVMALAGMAAARVRGRRK